MPLAIRSDTAVVTAAGHLAGLLIGNRTTPLPVPVPPPSALAERGLRDAGMHGYPGNGLAISRDMAALLGVVDDTPADPAGPGPRRDGRFAVPAAPPASLRMARAARFAVCAARAANPVTTTPATTTTVPPAQVLFRAMSVRDMLLQVAACAATVGDADCTHAGADGAMGYQDRLEEMTAALHDMPERGCDLALLHNAYYGLRPTLHRLRFLVMEIRSDRPDLAAQLSDWTSEASAHAIDLALGLPLGPEGEAVETLGAYGFIGAQASQPLAVHIARLTELRTQAEFEDNRRTIETVFQQIYAAGSREVDGASRDTMKGSMTYRLLHDGKITIRCPEARLPQILRAIPGGEIVLVSPSFLNRLGFGKAPANQFKAVYPPASGIRIVYWIGPHDRSYLVLVKADKILGQTYSLNRGRTWTQTGAPAGADLEHERTERWSSFLATRRQDEADPLWRSRGRKQPVARLPSA